MKFPSPFHADFWIDRDPDCVKYEHEPKVVPLFRNRDDGILQSHASHLSLEADRGITDADRRQQQLVMDLWRQKREALAEVARIDGMLEALAHG